MRLQDKLDTFARMLILSGKFPPPILEKRRRSTGELIVSGTADRAIKAVEVGPEFVLPDRAGRLRAHPDPVSLTSAAFRRWLGLVVLLTGSFVTSLDSFIVFVAVPSIRTSLGATFGETELIVAGYTLTAAVGLIVSGRLGDRFGRRRMFMIGFGAFTVASGLCGIAQSPVALIVSRLIQGCAASVLIPQVFALIRVTFADAKERAKAFGWMGVTIGVGAISGQIVGGLIIAADIWHLAWRPIFLINLPVGICALIGARC
jgi:MFS family permease